MPSIQCLPDQRTYEIEDGETILAAAQRAGVPHAYACGGNARCSTCRVWILDGLENCSARSEHERALSEPLGFGPEVRLACQTEVSGNVRLRRLVLDEADLEITSQIAKKRLGRCGETKNVVILFCDIRNFTGFSENLSAYDVMFVLNRFFYQIGEVVERNNGYIDNYIGDELMALFGMNDEPEAPLRAVKAAVEMLDAIDRLKPYMEAMYAKAFDIGVGLHYGEAVIGTVGSTSKEKLTAIGDAVNIASRIEDANKDAGTRLLISEELYQQVKDDVVMEDFVRVKLRGTSERKTLYEIAAIQPAALQRITEERAGDTHRQRFAGLDWVRVLAESDLPVGSRRVVQLTNFDLLMIRTEKTVYAMNNACPHMRLPLNESEITADGAIVCRWHQSHFDLETGEIRQWCTNLSEDGRSEGMEYLGDISKNRTPMQMLPTRIAEDAIWVAID